MLDAQIVLIGELVAREDHRHAHRGEQAGEGELDSLLGARNAIVLEEVEEPFVAEALDVVAADVVHRLRTVAETDQAAVDQLANGPFEARFLVVVAAEDRRYEPCV